MDGQTDRQTHGRTGRQAYMQTGRQVETQNDRQIDRHGPRRTDSKLPSVPPTQKECNRGTVIISLTRVFWLQLGIMAVLISVLILVM